MNAESATLAGFLYALGRTSDRATVLRWVGVSLDPKKAWSLVEAFPKVGFPTPADADAWVLRALPGIHPGS